VIWALTLHVTDQRLVETGAIPLHYGQAFSDDRARPLAEIGNHSFLFLLR
jgi:hypothetical protein